MLTDALKKLATLEFEPGKYEPAFDVCVRRFHKSNDGLDFNIGISGNGFEATRNLNRDDLISIRDWINEALQASEMEAA